MKHIPHRMASTPLNLQAARLAAGLGLLFSLWSCFAADEGPGNGAGGRPPGPPPEALAACKGKTEGAKVSFTGRRGETLTGTCQTTPQGLAARPDGMPGGPPPNR